MTIINAVIMVKIIHNNYSEDDAIVTVADDYDEVNAITRLPPLLFIIIMIMAVISLTAINQSFLVNK